MNLAPG
jgi:hypothetical protein